jgi:hypothetical protein
MLGTVFHYAVVEPKDNHADCYGQARSIIAMHERMGYRKGGAYNGHFCIHGESWVSYTGPNQATGNTWANLNLHAWCYLGTVGTPVTPEAQQAAYDLTLFEPTGRDQIYPHSAFFPTSCCGDPLREWIAAGANPPASGSGSSPQEDDDMRLIKNTDNGEWFLFSGYSWEQNVHPNRVFALAFGAKVPVGEMAGGDIFALAVSLAQMRADMIKQIAKEVPAGTSPTSGASVADVTEARDQVLAALNRPRTITGTVK